MHLTGHLCSLFSVGLGCALDRTGVLPRARSCSCLRPAGRWRRARRVVHSWPRSHPSYTARCRSSRGARPSSSPLDPGLLMDRILRLTHHFSTGWLLSLQLDHKLPEGLVYVGPISCAQKALTRGRPNARQPSAPSCPSTTAGLGEHMGEGSMPARQTTLLERAGNPAAYQASDPGQGPKLEYSERPPARQGATAVL